eukprot:403355951
MFMIGAPSLTFLILILPNAFTWYVALIVGIIYIGSLALNIMLLLKCSLTDPGIIPAIKSPNINKDEYYYVKYDQEGNYLNNSRMKGEDFYSTATYKLLPLPPFESDRSNYYKDDEDAERLVFCSTCNILRPPRSFHCNTCNVCIEQHDHHCPWVGTCVGKRNHRYFSLFLLYTSIHAALTCAITLTYFIQNYEIYGKVDMQNATHVLTIFIFTFSGIFFVTLICFWFFQNCLIIQNVTTNEHMRRKWNGSRRHTQMQERMRNKPSVWERMRYFYFSELPISKVQQYMKIKGNCNGVESADLLVRQNDQVQDTEELRQLNRRDDIESASNNDIVINNKFKSVDNESVLKDYGIIIPPYQNPIIIQNSQTLNV